ncbi:hypothetical protein ACRAWD_27500 [Caulobacter segnis]
MEQLRLSPPATATRATPRASTPRAWSPMTARSRRTPSTSTRPTGATSRRSSITGRRYVDRAYPVTDVKVYSNAPSTEPGVVNGACWRPRRLPAEDLRLEGRPPGRRRQPGRWPRASVDHQAVTEDT